MYYDKRFQLDPAFIFVAFSHFQIRDATTQSFLVARRSQFEEVSQRILSVDPTILQHIINRAKTGEKVIPATDEEKLCYRVLQDMESVAAKVDGSSAGRKWMRTEIWSLIAHLGSPIWYITIAPTDIKHPLCFYLADAEQAFKPNLQPPTTDEERDERFRAVVGNPVAGARFFHFAVQGFIKHVLGVDSGHDGIFGETSGYYATVEQ
ncbi:hypothetical protein EV122DRAFT_191965, partial [Schizophyllum commune]